MRPQKDEPNRTRITISGDRIAYPGDTGTKTGSLELVKLQLNDVLSTPQARFAGFDIKDFYLGTPLDRPEYVRIKLADIPQEFIDEYDLTRYAKDGWVYFEITKGVYGLKQAYSPNVCRNMATTNASPRQDCGATNGDQSPLSSSWTTSASNTSDNDMPSISTLHSNTTTR